jgi:hypothetical protein
MNHMLIKLCVVLGGCFLNEVYNGNKNICNIVCTSLSVPFSAQQRNCMALHWEELWIVVKKLRQIKLISDRI